MRLFIIILFLSTRLIAQTTDQRCYGHEDLKRIALKLVKLHESDTLLKNSEKVIAIDAKLLKNKDKEIWDMNRIVVQKDSIISGKNNEIKEVNLHLKKTKKKLIWSRVGWGGTSLGLILLMIFVHR